VRKLVFSTRKLEQECAEIAENLQECQKFCAPLRPLRTPVSIAFVAAMPRQADSESFGFAITSSKKTCGAWWKRLSGHLGIASRPE
jgi:hypothetical protein